MTQDAADAVGVALVGYGYWGVNLARNIDASRHTRLAGVVDISDERRRMANESFPEAKTWPDLDDALKDDAVEAVAIATLPRTHADLACRALDSGRHIFVEKPLALTVEDGERVVALSQEVGRVAMVGHTFLHSPAVTWLAEFIQAGGIGNVEYLYSQRLNLGRIRTDCNALWNFAPHDISIILHVLGEFPHEVWSHGYSYLQPGIEDVCFAGIEFPSGVAASIHVSWLDPRKTRLVTIVGDEKMIVYDDVSVDKKIAVYDAGPVPSSLEEFHSLGEFQWRTRAGDIYIPQIEMTEPLLLEVDDFGLCCRDSDRRSVTNADHGLDVVRLLSAMDRSMQAGGRRVDLEYCP